MINTTNVAGSQSRRWVVLAVMSCAHFMVLLDSTVVNVALPWLVEGLRFGATAQSWILDAYTLAFGGLLLLGSRAADIFGRRTVFLVGLALFTVASFGCGVASDPTQFIAARAAQGIGAALLAPAASSLVTVTFPAGNERNIAQGIWGGIGGLGATVGVVAGGLVVHLLGWRWAFYLNVPLGIAVGLAVFFIGAERSSSRRRAATQLSVASSVTITAGLLALVYTIVIVRSESWVSPVVLSSASVAILLFAAFVSIERKSAAPLLPRRMAADRYLLVAAISNFLVGAVQLSVLFLLSLQAQVTMHLDALRAGLSFLPMGVIAIAAAIAASRLVHRIGARPVYLTGTALGLVGLLMFAFQQESPSYVWALLVPSLLVGISLPTGNVVASIMGTKHAEHTDAGVVSGILAACLQIGSALGLAVTATIAAGGLRRGYLAIATFAVLSLINAAVGFRFPGDGLEHRRHDLRSGKTGM
ncbi:MFS transporter [Kribbella antibiotica]